jgi:hypothetical protein
MSDMTDKDKGYVDLILSAADGDPLAKDLLSMLEKGVVQVVGFCENGGAIIELTKQGKLVAETMHEEDDA